MHLYKKYNDHNDIDYETDRNTDDELIGLNYGASSDIHLLFASFFAKFLVLVLALALALVVI